MKSTVEQLSPTRVRINVEVPFAELEPDFQRAYKELAKQVRLPGFRPGKAPANYSKPHRPGGHAGSNRQRCAAQPVRTGGGRVGCPTARPAQHRGDQEGVRPGPAIHRRGRHPPEDQSPDLSALTVSVDPIEIGEDDVDAELQSLRTRFGTLTAVDRPVAVGDVVSIDLSATVDGEDIPNAAAEGLSHEVGSGRLIAGLDDAVVGLSADESRVFTAKLAAGEHAGQEAQVTVTVRSVKERELPEPDDEFAQLASEFDSIDELRASLSDQVRQAKRAQQAEQIRNATIDALLEQVDVPLPESYVQAQFDSVLHSALSGLNHDEARFNELLVEQGSSRAAFDAEARTASEKDVKRQLLLDALADELQVQVGQDDLTERLVTTSRQYGIEPQQLFGYLQERNQLPTMFADVRRELAIRAAVEAATVTDSDGNTIDTSEFFGKRVSAGEAEEAEPADEGAARAASDEATT